MESSMLTFVLLCVVWSNVAAIEVKIPEQVYEAVNGSDTTIPCKFETSVENPQSGVISWFRRDLNSSARNELILTYYYPDKIFDVAENVDAKGFSIDADLLNGKADLIIKNVEMEDNMIFECRVQIRGDIDGTNSNSATLVVLVAPSTPICEVQGNPKNGEDIKLTCVSNEASPPAEYKWQSLDAQNNPRDPEPKSTDNGGVLSLFGITTDTSGTYTCTSSNKVGSASCSLTLSVTPYGDEFSDKNPNKNDGNRRPDGEESSQ